MMKIGFTTSFPLEPLLAAGHQVIDLNNIFITGKSVELVLKAEKQGYPRNICSWIKGIYGAAAGAEFDYVMGIIQGDCSNTHSLLMNLADNGQKILYFSFPFDRDKTKLAKEIEQLENYFGVNRAQTMKVKANLDKIRRKLVTLDELTWQSGQVTGEENHYWLVNASDFGGNYRNYEAELDVFLAKAKMRELSKPKLRLGFLGVPPIFSDLYEYLESEGAQVVYNEIQRQFAMPYLKEDIVEQYWHYTYPYSINERLADIRIEVERRKLDGVISYTQSFCHRQIDNILIRKYLKVPVLTLEGDQPGVLEARSKLRIESYLDMLRYK
ncbi:MAG: 2-hydroxyacyl-CoA dehydratase [Candidatus Cloacimonetes bacterium]|nr:2-hydroxyacyl-CoA dehydratase [Candidatus Cloacimonadota bacterium]